MSDTQDKVIVNKGNEDNKDNAKETKTKVGKSKRKAAKETRDKLYAQDETNDVILDNGVIPILFACCYK